MKTKLLTLVVLTASLGVFAQGKIFFVNDSAHLYVLPGPVLPLDAAYAGQPVPGTLPSGITLATGLYAGTSSTSMSLQGAITFLTGSGLISPGRQAGSSTLLTIPGGVPQWFRILIWDSTYPAPDANQLFPVSFGSYLGCTEFFQATPGTSIAYPSIMPGSSANSTLAPGNIVVRCIPEPSASVLLLLGVGLLQSRWRKARSHS